MKDMKRLLHSAYRKTKNTVLYNPFFIWLAIRFVKKVAFTGYKSNKFIDAGYLPVPIHFYSPIPDIKSLARRKIWDTRSEMPGIVFNEKEQFALLKTLGKRYGNECNWPTNATNDQSHFYTRNSSFSYGCAAALHCMVRHNKPKRVLEIGSGLSSLVINEALKINKKEGRKGEHLVVDPFPCKQIKSGAIQVK